MNQKHRTNILLLIFYLVLSCLCMQNLNSRLLSSTNSRTDTLNARCPLPRIQFYDSQKNDTQSFGRKSTAEFIGLNGDALIYNYLSGDTNGVTSQAQKSMQGLILYFIFQIVGLAILIILGFVFICWLYRPYACPPCDRFKNRPDEAYTKCEMACPALIITLLSVILIGAMAILFIYNPALQKGYSDTRCSLATFFDDLLNGNYTRDNQDYFMGLKTLKANSTLITNLALNKYIPLVDVVEELDKDLDDTLEQGQNKLISLLIIVMYVIAGVTSLLAVALIISSLCISCCEKYNCRKVTYCSCSLMFFIAVLFFILSIGISGVTMGTHYGCNYIQIALQTRDQFQYRIKPVLKDQLLVQMVAQCVSDEGSGVVISSSPTSSNDNQNNLETSNQNLNPPHRLLQPITQINCKVLGQDIRLLTNTFCTQIFNYAYIARIVSIITSFSMLFIIICSTCLGVRAFRNSNLNESQTKDTAQISENKNILVEAVQSGEFQKDTLTKIKLSKRK